uniref:Uncharacterized protein n=2 Tax=Bombyx mori TaxID=7091 RepID=A0A8R2HR81_BOMMO|nr:uncharacterized protein LOC101741809 [Bombyx mori]
MFSAESVLVQPMQLSSSQEKYGLNLVKNQNPEDHIFQKPFLDKTAHSSISPSELLNLNRREITSKPLDRDYHDYDDYRHSLPRCTAFNFVRNPEMLTVSTIKDANLNSPRHEQYITVNRPVKDLKKHFNPETFENSDPEICERELQDLSICDDNEPSHLSEVTEKLLNQNRLDINSTTDDGQRSKDFAVEDTKAPTCYYENRVNNKTPCDNDDIKKREKSPIVEPSKPTVDYSRYSIKNHILNRFKKELIAAKLSKQQNERNEISEKPSLPEQPNSNDKTTDLSHKLLESYQNRLNEKLDNRNKGDIETVMELNRFENISPDDDLQPFENRILMTPRFNDGIPMMNYSQVFEQYPDNDRQHSIDERTTAERDEYNDDTMAEYNRFNNCLSLADHDQIDLPLRFDNTVPLDHTRFRNEFAMAGPNQSNENLFSAEYNRFMIGYPEIEQLRFSNEPSTGKYSTLKQNTESKIFNDNKSADEYRSLNRYPEVMHQRPNTKKPFMFTSLFESKYPRSAAHIDRFSEIEQRLDNKLTIAEYNRAQENFSVSAQTVCSEEISVTDHARCIDDISITDRNRLLDDMSATDRTRFLHSMEAADRNRLIENISVTDHHQFNDRLNDIDRRFNNNISVTERNRLNYNMSPDHISFVDRSPEYQRCSPVSHIGDSSRTSENQDRYLDGTPDTPISYPDSISLTDFNQFVSRFPSAHHQKPNLSIEDQERLREPYFAEYLRFKDKISVINRTNKDNFKDKVHLVDEDKLESNRLIEKVSMNTIQEQNGLDNKRNTASISKESLLDNSISMPSVIGFKRYVTDEKLTPSLVERSRLSEEIVPIVSIPNHVPNNEKISLPSIPEFGRLVIDENPIQSIEEKSLFNEDKAILSKSDHVPTNDKKLPSTEKSGCFYTDEKTKGSLGQQIQLNENKSIVSMADHVWKNEKKITPSKLNSDRFIINEKATKLLDENYEATPDNKLNEKVPMEPIQSHSGINDKMLSSMMEHNLSIDKIPPVFSAEYNRLKNKMPSVEIRLDDQPIIVSKPENDGSDGKLPTLSTVFNEIIDKMPMRPMAEEKRVEENLTKATCKTPVLVKSDFNPVHTKIAVPPSFTNDIQQLKDKKKLLTKPVVFQNLTERVSSSTIEGNQWNDRIPLGSTVDLKHKSLDIAPITLVAEQRPLDGEVPKSEHKINNDSMIPAASSLEREVKSPVEQIELGDKIPKTSIAEYTRFHNEKPIPSPQKSNDKTCRTPPIQLDQLNYKFSLEKNRTNDKPENDRLFDSLLKTGQEEFDKNLSLADPSGSHSRNPIPSPQKSNDKTCTASPIQRDRLNHEFSIEKNRSNDKSENDRLFDSLLKTDQEEFDKNLLLAEYNKFKEKSMPDNSQLINKFSLVSIADQDGFNKTRYDKKENNISKFEQGTNNIGTEYSRKNDNTTIVEETKNDKSQTRSHEKIIVIDLSRYHDQSTMEETKFNCKASAENRIIPIVTINIPKEERERFNEAIAYAKRETLNDATSLPEKNQDCSNGLPNNADVKITSITNQSKADDNNPSSKQTEHNEIKPRKFNPKTKYQKTSETESSSHTEILKPVTEVYNIETSIPEKNSVNYHMPLLDDELILEKKIESDNKRNVDLLKKNKDSLTRDSCQTIKLNESMSVNDSLLDDLVSDYKQESKLTITSVTQGSGAIITIPSKNDFNKKIKDQCSQTDTKDNVLLSKLPFPFNHAFNKADSSPRIEIKSNVVIRPASECENKTSIHPVTKSNNSISTLINAAEAISKIEHQFKSPEPKKDSELKKKPYASGNSDNKLSISNKAQKNEYPKDSIVSTDNNQNPKILRKNPQVVLQRTNLDQKTVSSKSRKLLQKNEKIEEDNVTASSLSSNEIASKRTHQESCDVNDFESLITENQIYEDKIVVKEKTQDTSQEDDLKKVRVTITQKQTKLIDKPTVPITKIGEKHSQKKNAQKFVPNKIPDKIVKRRIAEIIANIKESQRKAKEQYAQRKAAEKAMQDKISKEAEKFKKPYDKNTKNKKTEKLVQTKATETTTQKGTERKALDKVCDKVVQNKLINTLTQNKVVENYSHFNNTENFLQNQFTSNSEQMVPKNHIEIKIVDRSKGEVSKTPITSTDGSIRKITIEIPAPDNVEQQPIVGDKSLQMLIEKSVQNKSDIVGTTVQSVPMIEITPHTVEEQPFPTDVLEIGPLNRTFIDVPPQSNVVVQPNFVYLSNLPYPNVMMFPNPNLGPSNALPNHNIYHYGQTEPMPEYHLIPQPPDPQLEYYNLPQAQSLNAPKEIQLITPNGNVIQTVTANKDLMLPTNQNFAINPQMYYEVDAEGNLTPLGNLGYNPLIPECDPVVDQNKNEDVVTVCPPDANIPTKIVKANVKAMAPKVNDEVSTLDLYEKRRRIKRIKYLSNRPTKVLSKKSKSKRVYDNPKYIITPSKVSEEVYKEYLSKINEKDGSSSDSDDDEAQLKQYLEIISKYAIRDENFTDKTKYMSGLKLMTKEAYQEKQSETRRKSPRFSTVASANITNGKDDRFPHARRDTDTSPPASEQHLKDNLVGTDNSILQHKKSFLSLLNLGQATEKYKKGYERTWQENDKKRKRRHDPDDDGPGAHKPKEPKVNMHFDTNNHLQLLSQIKIFVNENNNLIKKRIDATADEEEDESIKVLADKNFSELSRLSKMANRSVKLFTGQDTKKRDLTPGFDSENIEKSAETVERKFIELKIPNWATNVPLSDVSSEPLHALSSPASDVSAGLPPAREAPARRPVRQVRDAACQATPLTWPGFESFKRGFQLFDAGRRKEMVLLHRLNTGLRVEGARITRLASHESDRAKALLAEREHLAAEERIIRKSLHKLCRAVETIRRAPVQ